MIIIVSVLAKHFLRNYLSVSIYFIVFAFLLTWYSHHDILFRSSLTCLVSYRFDYHCKRFVHPICSCLKM
jgi:hypothetical protein